MPPAVVSTTPNSSELNQIADSGNLFDLAPVGCFILGRDGKIHSCNTEGARLLGQEPAALTGIGFVRFVDATNADRLDTFLRDVFAGAAATAGEVELVIEENAARTLWINATLFPDRQECLAVAVDITRQKQAERALRESERRFRDVADVSADWIWEVDTDGRYTYASESVRTLLGYTPEDIIGKTAFDLMPPDEAARVAPIFGAVTQRGEPFRDLENIVLDSQGRRHDCLTNGTPIRDLAGQVIGYRGVDRDITQQRRAENALKASRQHFQDIVNTTDGIVWEADARTFTFTFVSKQAERLLGYPVEAWLQPGFWIDKLHPEDREWAPAYCASCTGRAEPHDFEYRFIAKDGSIIWLHDIVTVVTGDNGEPQWLRGIMVDVTARVQSERSLRDLAEDLERQVAERTDQVRQLAAQLTVAEERERRKLALDLHDNLGQLLAVIKITLCSLDQTLPAGPIAALTDLIHQAENTVRSITQQLSPPVLHALGLTQGLEWLGEEIERVYGIEVYVEHEVCGVNPTAEVQAVLFRSVRELLINVAKHAAVDAASITFLCEHGRLVLVVSDAGRGFDAARARAADPAQGFGLRSIGERIRYLGGEMEIDSGPGIGTTVTLSMPCA
jgi:PAS domain S-box-containing protein